MASRNTMNVSLTPALERFVSKRVKSGRYQSASEVVREALRLMERQEAERNSALKEVREKVAAGLRQASRGETVDADEAFKRLRRNSTKFKASRG